MANRAELCTRFSPADPSIKKTLPIGRNHANCAMKYGVKNFLHATVDWPRIDVGENNRLCELTGGRE